MRRLVSIVVIAVIGTQLVQILILGFYLSDNLELVISAVSLSTVSAAIQISATLTFLICAKHLEVRSIVFHDFLVNHRGTPTSKMWR